MILYRVRYSAEGGNQGGYSWHTSMRDAQTAANQAVKNDPIEYAPNMSGPPAIDRIEIKLTKAGVLQTLTRYATEPNNG